jgi:hypothetical protein
MGAIQLPVLYLAGFLIHKTPRRSGTYIVWGGACVLGSLFLFQSVTQHMLLSTVLLGITRALVTYGHVVYSFLSIESFPVEIQSTASAIILNMGVLVHALSPFLVGFAQMIGINPMGFISFLLIIPTMCGYYLR